MCNSIKRLMIGGLLALAVIFPINSMAGDTLSRVVDFKVLKVGMSGNQPPMNTKNREGGLMGFDVDLAKAMAAAMKVQLDIKVMPFGELMTALQDRHGDFRYGDHTRAYRAGLFCRPLYDVRQIHSDQKLRARQNVRNR